MIAGVRQRPALVFGLCAALAVNLVPIGLIAGPLLAMFLLGAGTTAALTESADVKRSAGDVTADVLVWGVILVLGGALGIVVSAAVQPVVTWLQHFVGIQRTVVASLEAKLTFALAFAFLVLGWVGAWRWDTFTRPTLDDYNARWLGHAAAIGVVFGLGALIVLPFRSPPSQVPCAVPHAVGGVVQYVVAVCPAPTDYFGKAADVATRMTFLTAIFGLAILLALALGARAGRRCAARWPSFRASPRQPARTRPPHPSLIA